MMLPLNRSTSHHTEHHLHSHSVNGIHDSLDRCVTAIDLGRKGKLPASIIFNSQSVLAADKGEPQNEKTLTIPRTPLHHTSRLPSQSSTSLC